MKMRRIFLVVMCLLALSTFAVSGCVGGSGSGGGGDLNGGDAGESDGGGFDGGAVDGGSQNDGGVNDGGSQDDGGQDDGGESDGGPDDGGQDDGGSQDDGGQDDGGQDDGGQEDGGHEDDVGEPLNCPDNDFFIGQTYVPDDGMGNPDRDAVDSHNGGNAVEASQVALVDAGLEAVVDAVPDTIDDDSTPDDDEGAAQVELDVVQALVVGTGRTDNPQTDDVFEGNAQLYLQDADAAVMLWFAFDEGEGPDEAVRVGDRVSMTVTEVKNFDGHPEITGATGFQIVDRDNDVPYTDLTGDEIPADLYGQNVRVSGELTDENGACPAGSPSICYELTHGEQRRTVSFRSSSSLLQEGDCVTYFGPLGAFPAPLNPDDDPVVPQLDSVNWEWAYSTSP